MSIAYFAALNALAVVATVVGLSFSGSGDWGRAVAAWVVTYLALSVALKDDNFAVRFTVAVGIPLAGLIILGLISGHYVFAFLVLGFANIVLFTKAIITANKLW